jgi:hypothetical protein
MKINRMAPIIAGIIANPAMIGPKLPKSKLPNQAPTNPATIDPIMPPGMLFFTKMSAIYPMMIAITILISKPI